MSTLSWLCHSEKWLLHSISQFSSTDNLITLHNNFIIIFVVVGGFAHPLWIISLNLTVDVKTDWYSTIYPSFHGRFSSFFYNKYLNSSTAFQKSTAINLCKLFALLGIYWTSVSSDTASSSIRQLIVICEVWNISTHIIEEDVLCLTVMQNKTIVVKWTVT